jgi:signal transduction histidine kinase
MSLAEAAGMLRVTSNVARLARRHWRTTTIRWLYAYAALFVISASLIVTGIGWVATRAIERDTDSNLVWQIRYFDSVADPQLPGAIHQRLEHERRHTDYYGLFDATGQYIAGDIARQPDDLAETPRGLTLAHSLALVDGTRSPVVRAMGEVRNDGKCLVVARDMTSVMLIREIIMRSLAAGCFIAILVGVGGTLVLGMRQLSRIREMRRVTRCIAEGDLSKRLPVGRNRDEIDMLADLVNHMLDEIEHLMDEVKGACDGIAHDLRTPLVRLHALLGRIGDRECVRRDHDGQSLLDAARAETDRLLERFHAMLRISEISTLQRRSSFVSIDLTELVGELGDLYEPLAESSGLQWQVDIQATEPLHGDRALLFEAFSNLLDNAIKFTPSGGKVRLSLHDSPRGALLEVSDDGPGIPPDERGAVLQRFYRSESAQQLAGSGLGLSIVEAVLKLHDFKLHIGYADEANTSGTSMRVDCWPSALAGRMHD